MAIDVVSFAQDLIRRPSVTPADAGAMDVLEQALAAMGFDCRRMKFREIENLYARLGTAGPNLCFAGHTDVVPVGDAAAWRSGPFAGEIKDGVLYGRGAVDMKGAIAAFAAAVSARLEAGAIKGSISFLITGDEEGPAIDGTEKIVRLLQSQGEQIDHCVLGEPTSSKFLGDQVKIGRRGSLNAVIEVTGKQGHVAYPHLAANPVPVLVRLLAYLSARVLDAGHPQFPASNLEITTVDVGNTASNVIPARATAHVNIRFNPLHDGTSLSAWLEAERQRAQAGFEGTVTLTPKLTGNAFITESGPFVDVVSGAVKDALGHDPVASTTGGISDARFIRALCPVVEVGLVGATMHAVDECTPVEDLRGLQTVYERLIDRYFAAFAG